MVTFAATTNASVLITTESYYDEMDDYNISDYEKPCSMEEFRGFRQKFTPVAFSLIFVLGLVGNILVVLTFSCYKRTKSMTDVFLLNMAIADIMFVFTLPFWAVYYHEKEWVFRDFMCKLVRSIYAINLNCSMLLLACVGIDRYVAIVQVTKSFRFRATAMAYKRVICLFVWLISVCLSSTTYSFTTFYKINDSRVCEANYQNNSTARTWKLAVLAVQISIGFFIPLLVIVFCYSFIIKTLLQAQNSQRHKAIRVVVAVVAVFLFCQVPYNVLLMEKAVELSSNNHSCDGRIKIAYARFITETLAFFHCCLNPVIYAFVGVQFRNYFVKIMQDLSCISKKYITGTRNSRISSDIYTSRRTSEVYATEGGSSFTM
ncbi:hypothetical protein FKM82_017562 [Ascaphus truei]|uniref:C-C chemokine receptor type 6 n=1 Tax=Ascaphus truei TaxID=8439 RepID=UPI003F595169